jgi:hypothetical protein
MTKSSFRGHVCCWARVPDVQGFRFVTTNPELRRALPAWLVYLFRLTLYVPAGHSFLPQRSLIATGKYPNVQVIDWMLSGNQMKTGNAFPHRVARALALVNPLMLVSPLTLVNRSTAPSAETSCIAPRLRGSSVHCSVRSVAGQALLPEAARPLRSLYVPRLRVLSRSHR